MAIRIRISEQDLPRELLRRSRQVRRAISAGLAQGARDAKALLVSRTPEDTGNLRNAWTLEIRTRGGTVRTLSGTALEVILENDAPYAGVVLEKGARPHPVSREGQEAIYRWVLRNFRGIDEVEAYGIAQKIVWNIRQNGSKPTYIIRNSMGDVMRLVHKNVSRSVSSQAGRR